ncbi:sodium-dependent phosphate transporter [Haladaptatus paucihalophilus DX253]|uniref:Phosphate transporter n=2 Tax=Haladaptatus TaxID=367188 RepID=E7QNS3_HALPU|nr:MULTISPECIES: inorganic phosphate transporter [Haladaptatus]EFW93576.1 sodium-dependent phosphate transporter [Haladaptatus paucihalophilus DX253]GKZ14915.1 anion permease [Haladaptatus sp. T7]SHL44156.1 inorganic phosphate transporter, PiT family [Haladaptatus paucihalophilus DX253]
MAGGLLTVIIAGVASLFMAWAIGAGSSGSTPFAPAVGANALSVMRAGFLVGILGFLGAALQGANVSQAVGRELIHGVQLSPLAATTGLLTAAILVAIGVFTGYPIATAFTVTGAIVGVGLALGGTPAWPKYQQIVSLWILTPFIGGGIAYATARVLRRDDVAEETSIPLLAGLVGLIIANVGFVFLGPPHQSASIAQSVGEHLSLPAVAGLDLGVVVTSLVLAGLVAVALKRELDADVSRGQRRFLLALGGLVAFSAGGSQVGLAIGPLLPLLDPYSIPVVPVLIGGGLGLLAGSWTGAPRMIKALAQDYSALGPRRSIAALIPAFAIAQSAVFFGIPVSFNEIIVSTIIGSGYAASGGGVSGKKMIYTILAWVLSLALALGVGYGVFTAVDAVL